MSHIERNPRRGRYADWTVLGIAQRDGFGSRLSCDSLAIRQQNRSRRHADATTLHRIARGSLDPDAATYAASARRDVYALPSW